MKNKSLILIGAYCPDYERQTLLKNLLKSLEKTKQHFDILISSHSKINDDMLNEVDYFFYDKSNKLIYDLDYINQPWFSPKEGETLYSTYITGYSTYLTVYRLFISGLGIAKTMGYKKVHYIEYDTYFNSTNELYENDRLLDTYGAVNYKKEYKNFENNLQWGIGNFMSINLNKVNNIFLEYDEEKLLNLIRNHPSKTNERTTEEILSKSSLYSKSYDLLINEKILTNLSSDTKKDEMSIWAVPFYNSKNNTIDFVCWNNKYEEPINVKVIVNDDKFLKFKNVNKFQYYLDELGDYDKIDTILVIVNDKIKLKIDFNQIDKEKFKKTNFVKYE